MRLGSSGVTSRKAELVIHKIIIIIIKIIIIIITTIIIMKDAEVVDFVQDAPPKSRC